MRAFVEGVGLLGPGLQGWPAARRVLSGEEPLRSASTVITASELLPPAERRRTPVSVKLATWAQRLVEASRDLVAMLQ